MENANKAKKDSIRHRFFVELFPSEALFGIKIRNCELLCDDDIMRPLIGIQFGLIFITFEYGNLAY